MNDIFLKIISREIPSEVIWESDTHIAFLDIRPIEIGHTLVVPKKYYEYIFDIPDSEYLELMLSIKKVAEILKSKLNCARVCMIVEGYEVPHVHVKLIPTNTPFEIKPTSDPEKDPKESPLREVASIIRS